MNILQIINNLIVDKKVGKEEFYSRMSKKLGKSPNTIKNYIKGNTPLNYEFIEAALLELGIQLDIKNIDEPIELKEPEMNKYGNANYEKRIKNLEQELDFKDRESVFNDIYISDLKEILRFLLMNHVKDREKTLLDLFNFVISEFYVGHLEFPEEYMNLPYDELPEKYKEKRDQMVEKRISGLIKYYFSHPLVYELFSKGKVKNNKLVDEWNLYGKFANKS